MEFVALDFETANRDWSSICQIGLVHIKDGLIHDEWKAYVDPEDYFEEINILKHRIDKNTIKGASNFRDISSRIYNYLDNRIVVCHTSFDRVALHKACKKYGLRVPKCRWLDSALVTKRTWEQVAYRGYGLKNVCAILGYQFTHHDALEDAKASAYVLRSAIEKTGIDLQQWLIHVKKPIGAPDCVKIYREGNPDGFYYGEVMVFTGNFQVKQSKAAEIAAKIGFTVDDRVTRRTTFLVEGVQDVKKLAGYKNSSKQRKAEKLKNEGYVINAVSESEFNDLVLSAEYK